MHRTKRQNRSKIHKKDNDTLLKTEIFSTYLVESNMEVIQRTRDTRSKEKSLYALKKIINRRNKRSSIKKLEQIIEDMRFSSISIT